MLQSRAARNAACAKTYFDPSIRLPGRLDLVPRFRLISGLERTMVTVRAGDYLGRPSAADFNAGGD